ncbi:SLC5/6 family protein [Lacunimicrobium album]
MENASQVPAPNPPSSTPAASGQGGEQWGSRIGVILAVAGSAVGLGNFLRFPGQVALNGGGAYMIPYFVSLLILGIPLCWAEWTMGRFAGRHGNNSAPSIYHFIWPNPISLFFGMIGVIVPLIIYMYYVLIESWCLAYALNYLDGTMMQTNDFGKFFDGVTGAGVDGYEFNTGYVNYGFIILFVFVINFALIYRGVSKGIERFCQLAMPLMLICGVIVLIRVFTLDAPVADKPDQNLYNGLGYMWNPDFTALGNPKTWLAAAGQIFFSLSVGFGVIINYSSYLKKKDEIALSSLTACSVNEFFEVCMGGLITIPAAFMFLGVLDPTIISSSFKVGFVALPNVFAHMPAGQFFGFLWFFMLFLAAITSSISMLQPVIAFLEEGLGLKRYASVTILGLITALGLAFVLYFSKNLTALDTLDFWIGTFMLFVLAMFQSILYGWILGPKQGEIEMHHGAHLKVPSFVQFMLQYITPVYLIVIFVLFCYWNMGEYIQSIIANPVSQMSIGFIALIATFIMILVIISHKRWQKQGRKSRFDIPAES